MALTTDLGQFRDKSIAPSLQSMRARTGVVFRPGALVAHRKNSNLLEVPLSASKRTDLIVCGVYVGKSKFTAGADGGGGAAVDADGNPQMVQFEPGPCGWFDTGANGDQVLDANVGVLCYAYDDNTVYLTDLSVTISPAGRVLEVGQTGTQHAGKVRIYIPNVPTDWAFQDGADAVTSFEAMLASTTNGEGAALIGVEDSGSHYAGTTVEAVLAEIRTDMVSTSNGKGAARVGIEDAGTFTTAVTVEAALAELYKGAKTVQAQVDVPLASSIDAATGALLAVFADGGSSTTPGTELSNSKAVSVRWNNHATPGAIAITVPLPQDLDLAGAVVVHALVSKTGATIGDATKLTIGAYLQTPAALHDADTNFGGDSDAVVGNATAKTVKELTLSLAAVDFAANSAITLTIKPKDGTLGTDDFLLHACWLEYKRAILTS